jgi:hypothetical protein
MKYDFAGVGDLLDDLRAVASVGVPEAEHLVSGDPRWWYGDNVFLQQIPDFVIERAIARMAGGKPIGIGTRSVLAENWFVEDRLRKM